MKHFSSEWHLLLWLKTWLFPVYVATILWGQQILSSQSCRLSIQAFTEKNGFKKFKGYSKKLLQRFIFFAIAKEPDGVKIR